MLFLFYLAAPRFAYTLGSIHDSPLVLPDLVSLVVTRFLTRSALPCGFTLRVCLRVAQRFLARPDLEGGRHTSFFSPLFKTFLSFWFSTLASFFPSGFPRSSVR